MERGGRGGSHGSHIQALSTLYPPPPSPFPYLPFRPSAKPKNVEGEGGREDMGRVIDLTKLGCDPCIPPSLPPPFRVSLLKPAPPPSQTPKPFKYILHFEKGRGGVPHGSGDIVVCVCCFFPLVLIFCCLCGISFIGLNY